MSGAHTVGPWSRDRYGHIVDAQGCEVLFRGVTISMAGPRVAEAESNTDLTAAAPELLDAARATIAAVEDQIGTGWSDAQIYDMTSVALSEAYFKARAALAKATGQQPDPTR